MNDSYQMTAIGAVTLTGKQRIITILHDIIPAIKHLSRFSHATLVFGDGSPRPFRLRVVELAEVDETNGHIALGRDSGLQEGNILYDIKPYIPCEDRLPSSRVMADSFIDSYILPGGRMETTLPIRGLIRREQNRHSIYPKDFECASALAQKCSHIKVLWWFSHYDKGSFLQEAQGVPPYEPLPPSGVLAMRGPARPNPIALTAVQVLDVNFPLKRIEVAGLDCFDKTPLVGLEPYQAEKDAIPSVRVPQWLGDWPAYKETALSRELEEIHIDDTQTKLLERLLPSGAVPADPDIRLFAADAEVQPQRDEISIRGARQNNLDNLDLVLPKKKLIAIAGVSGSGKSSLAFDTLYAESRLRLSDTTESIGKPDVDSITGLPPAVAVAQRAIGRNPRSTVGTLTGAGDSLRFLYAAIGRRHCPGCGRAIRPRSRDELMELLDGLKEHKLTITPYGGAGSDVSFSATTMENVEKALELGGGAFTLRVDDSAEVLLQTCQMCCRCGIALPDMSPALFSFNHPQSMCPQCNGLGTILDIDPSLVVARPDLSLLDGASDYFGNLRIFAIYPTANWMQGEVVALAQSRKIDLSQRWRELPEDFRKAVLYGDEELEVCWHFENPKIGRSGTMKRRVAGAIPTIRRLIAKGGTASEAISKRYVREFPCPGCGGERLNRQGRMVTVAGLRYPQAASLSIDELLEWVHGLPGQLSTRDQIAGKELLLEIRKKAVQLKEVGLSYLQLDRALPTLSGGELQRLKLVAQMGIGLSGLLYVMDEPTAGLHPKDYPGMLNTLSALRDAGNTVLIVEHEEAVLLAADYLVEIGPGAGQCGGKVVWQGPPDALADAGTQTARYLTGKARVAITRPPLPPEKDWVQLHGAKGNNLKNIDVTFPKRRITCITGVSGSGKSTLAANVLAPALTGLLNRQPVGPYCDSIVGAEEIQGVVHVSQSFIGRNRRSTVATYMGLLDMICPLFSATAEAKAAGLTASSFRFNSRAGQCDACKGEGIQNIPVPFARDIHTVCPVCHGKRYKKHVLAVTYQGRSIFDVLEMPVLQARAFFESNHKILPFIEVLCEVGLGYLKIGQGVGTLSGGEAQRVKLAKALCERKGSHLLYILDEPTSGLHFSDIQTLLQMTAKLTVAGNTVLIIEHNRHVIRNADWVIDLGPEGGEGGGQVVVQGTPETVADFPGSHTGTALRKQSSLLIDFAFS